MNARYYNSFSGRFISQDKMFWNPENFLSDPQQLNSYSYARNNPILYEDQNGEFVQIIVATAGGAILGGAIGGTISVISGGNFWDGAKYGAIAGATAGLVISTAGLAAPALGLTSAEALVGGSAVGNALGGVAARTSFGQETTAGDVGLDFVLGGAGGMLGEAVSGIFAKSVSKFKLGTFPTNPDELMPELSRDAKGRIYPNENTRIRIEDHGPTQNGEMIPRHSELHYHVEVRTDPSVGWGNDNLVTRSWNGVKAFLPGEEFPGTTIKIGN